MGDERTASGRAEGAMRGPNQIDVWRGFALLMIFINHVPGHFLVPYTLRNFAVCDAAELFVFLAGWSLWYATRGVHKGASPLFARLWLRAADLYAAQLATQLIALAIIATAALKLENPLYLEWHNAGPAFYDPSRALIGTALMTYQLGYFNILPMYVVLMLMAPVLLAVLRLSWIVGIALSVAIYGWAAGTGMTPPSWPSDEQWFFNPLSWQLLMVLGYLSAEVVTRHADVAGKWIGRLLPLAAAGVVLGALIAVSGWRPDPTLVPWPRYLFLLDKTYLSPARIANLLALAVAFAWLYPRLAPLLGPVPRWLSLLGRNSLAVFCFGSLASLLGQILHFESKGSLTADFSIVVLGFSGMFLTAWLVEWRKLLSR